MQLPNSIFNFLQKLAKNNNREWFNVHKDAFKAEEAHFKVFANAVLDRMSAQDNIERLKVFRIYRDVRFSKNKSPYKTHFSASLTRATKWLRGGYYFHLQPGGESFVGGGFWGPDAADLKRIRSEIAANADELRAILAQPKFIETFGTLEGDQVKSAPRGYAKDHPAIDLLRYKQYLLVRRFDDKEVFQVDFLDKVVDTFQAMRPFFDYMSEVLTTDENGVPID